jgi:hypothetical protein
MAWDETITKETREAVYNACLGSPYAYLLAAVCEYSVQNNWEKITVAESEVFAHDRLVNLVYHMIQNTNISDNGCFWIDGKGKFHVEIQE